MPRPRDEYGRPLPHGRAGVPGVPERTSIDGETAWAEAMAYLAADRPFHAHEVFEQRWRCCPPAERAAWQACAQWAAALTHRARGNPTGARSVARTALAGLDGAPLMPPAIDVAAVRSSLSDVLP